jgi:two-component system, OmpR family, phosphate regulon sensor histidine kinase PhoR
MADEAAPFMTRERAVPERSAPPPPSGQARGLGATDGPARIVLVYAAVGVTWILFSDRLLELLVQDAAQRSALQTAKGFFYVVATAALLYALIRRYLGRVRALDEQIRAVLDSMADAVLVIDRGGRVVDVNQSAMLLLAARFKEELLLPLEELLRKVDLRRPDGQRVELESSAVRRALRGQIAGDEALLRSADGSEHFVGVSAAPVRAWRGERPRTAVVVIRDMSEVKRFEETREDFLATAAHELKTPLAVVKAHAQLMARRGQGDPAALAVMDRQIDRLTGLVQRLLEVSRFRVGGPELRREPFDLAALVTEVVEAARGRAGGRVIALAAEGATALGDRGRIARVVESLVDNALRYSPPERPVEAAVEVRGGEAVVSVRDQGVGIAPERQGRVFERFYRAHPATARDPGGLGISLGASREIVARHGGRLWFESAPGRGSTFWFSLPVAGPRA